MPNKQKTPKAEFSDRHARDFDEMQEKCYQGLHKPMVIKVQGFTEKIWYICQEDLDAYMKDHSELKKLVIAFKR